MYCVVKKEFEVNGYYEELIYDDAPSYGNYTRDVCFNISRGQFLEVTKKGHVKYVNDSDSIYNFGASMYGTKLYITDNMKNNMKAGFLLEVKNSSAYHEFLKTVDNLEETYEDCMY